MRDNPAVLAAAMIALTLVVIGMGYLTARIGTAWAKTYAHRQVTMQQQ